MASGAISAQGTEFLIGDEADLASTTLTYTKVADLEDLNGPSESNNFTEITNHDSSAVERIATLEDPGAIDATISFQPNEVTHASGSSGLRGLLRNQTKRAMRIKYPTTGSDVDEFQGWVSEFNPSAPTADVLTADVTIQVAGPVTSTSS